MKLNRTSYVMRDDVGYIHFGPISGHQRIEASLSRKLDKKSSPVFSVQPMCPWWSLYLARCHCKR